jgi:RNase P subunit RPR2
MPALAEIQSTVPPRGRVIAPRMSSRLVCSICADTMVAAEASAFLSDDVVSYLWTCDTCGHGFVTKYDAKKNASA